VNPTILISALLLPLLGIDPQALRQQVDSLPWRPAPGRIVAAPSAAAPVAPAGEDSVANPSSSTRKPDSARSAAAPAAVAPAARLDSRGTWQLQVAALANPDVAKREQARLEKSLGAGSITLVVENGLTKLRWGQFPSREAADAARSDLKTYRLEGFPVKSSP